MSTAFERQALVAKILKWHDEYEAIKRQTPNQRRLRAVERLFEIEDEVISNQAFLLLKDVPPDVAEWIVECNKHALLRKTGEPLERLMADLPDNEREDLPTDLQ